MRTSKNISHISFSAIFSLISVFTGIVISTLTPFTAKAALTTTTSFISPTLLTQQSVILDPSLVKVTLPTDTNLGTQAGTTSTDTTSNTSGVTATQTDSSQQTGLSATQITDTTATTTTTSNCSPRDPLCTQNSGTTTQQADTTTGTSNQDTSAARPDLSGLVEMETLDVSTQQTQQESGTQCIATTESAAGTSAGICITPGQAAQAAAPEIINNQTKITIVVIIATLIGLALTILISYILNSAANRRELKRIQKQQSDGPRQFAQKQVSASYQNVTEQIANIIFKTANSQTPGQPPSINSQPGAINSSASRQPGTSPLSTDDIRNLQKALGSIELFGSPETSKSAQELLKLLYRHQSAGTPSSKTPHPTPTDFAQINQAATRLAESLKKDL